MSFEEIRCLIPVCDSCGFDWNEHETIPHLSAINIRVAREVLASIYRWTITKQPDGTHAMLCRGCSTGGGCENGQHDWYEPELDTDWTKPVPAEPLEMCRRCGCVRRDQHPLVVPPATSPETATVALTLEEQAHLALCELEFTDAESRKDH